MGEAVEVMRDSHTPLVGPALARRLAAGWPGLAGLLLLCLAVYLPGFVAMPPVDRDEPRFAQASRQMLESGDFVIPRVLDRERLNKPPLVYWLQSASAWVFTGGDVARDAIWMYRVPSLLAAICTVLLTWRWGCTMFDPRVAWTAAALLALCPLMWWEARQGRADMTLLAFTTAACWLLWEVWRRRAARGPGATGQAVPPPDPCRLPQTHPVQTLPPAIALWIAVGFGTLTKGPMTLMVVVLGAFALGVITRDWRHIRAIRPILAVVVLTAMVLPWIALVAQRVGWAAYAEIVRYEIIGRSIAPREGHEGPSGYHVLLTALLFWPGVLFAGIGVWRAFRVGTRSDARAGSWFARLRGRLQTLRPGRAPELFLLAVLAPTWFVMELVSTKLPHYTLPVYPALALLAARAVFSADVRRWLARPALRVVTLAAAIPGVGLLAGAGTLTYLALLGRSDTGKWILPGGYLFLAAAYAAFTWRSRARPGRALAISAAAALIAGVSLGRWLPHAPPLWVAHRTLAAVRDLNLRPGRDVAFVKLHEDSTVFESRGTVYWVDEHRLKAWLALHPQGVVVLPADCIYHWPRFHTLAIVSGVNYSTGAAGDWHIGEMLPLWTPPQP